MHKQAEEDNTFFYTVRCVPQYFSQKKHIAISRPYSITLWTTEIIYVKNRKLTAPLRSNLHGQPVFRPNVKVTSYASRLIELRFIAT